MHDRNRRPWAVHLGPLILVAALAVAACGSSGATTAPSSAAASGNPYEGSWLLTVYTSPDGTEKNVPVAVTPTLIISGDSVTGNAGCNTYSSSMTVDGDTVTFGPVQSTQLSCDGPGTAVELAFLQALNLANKWTIANGKLVISAPGGDPSLTFVKGQ